MNDTYPRNYNGLKRVCKNEARAVESRRSGPEYIEKWGKE